MKLPKEVPMWVIVVSMFIPAMFFIWLFWLYEEE